MMKPASQKIAAWFAASILLGSTAATLAAPIREHPDNPRWFVWQGKVTALTTSAEHYGAVLNLVEQGWADPNEVARAFGCSGRTVRRHQRRFESGGLAALGHRGGYPEGRRQLPDARSQLIPRL